MSLWQYMAAVNGWVKANTPQSDNKLTEAEADDLFDWIESQPGRGKVLSTQTYWWDGDWPVPAGVVTFAAQ